jgi:hypothetical protein
MKKILSLSSSLFREYEMIGALIKMEEDNLIDNVDIYAGVSTSSIIALLLAIGCTTKDIANFIITEKIYIDPTYLFSINSIEENENLIEIKIKLMNFVEEKCGFVPSICQLYLLNQKYFVTAAIDKNTNNIVYISPSTTPNTSCVDAVIFSMKIPYIYQQEEFLDIYKHLHDSTINIPMIIDFFKKKNNPYEIISLSPFYETHYPVSNMKINLENILLNYLNHNLQTIIKKSNHYCTHYQYNVSYFKSYESIDKFIPRSIINGYMSVKKSKLLYKKEKFKEMY